MNATKGNRSRQNRGKNASEYRSAQSLCGVPVVRFSREINSGPLYTGTQNGGKPGPVICANQVRSGSQGALRVVSRRAQGGYAHRTGRNNTVTAYCPSLHRLQVCPESRVIRGSGRPHLIGANNRPGLHRSQYSLEPIYFRSVLGRFR